ncbi:MAG: co-chaperone DjlA [Candidatus Competibacteraceae bacterium]|uniref:DnaJ-like protein DjlA n=1 Tax=Candidatus Contendobacter odensis Run_B_J11 TaxID=1400861 RepID=A0A7U7G9P1_9GAMM|nr:co-chaperone DjlA [Candidatus Contendobacter odensis]MBK8534809.1 co-chaperone DjlA [Candidatus Competibacteraceae bacterium]MBK8753541.1 co-chaperone DjlA [Candidatus Competibacteraceae bacterium]CDH44440.1 putative DnaJ-like protein DjlA [Candidatus Contendobacter odensis Run_B_J11]
MIQRGIKIIVFGKLFGGAFGFMVGGPLGALIGAAVGHNFDQGDQKKVAAPTAAEGGDHTQITFIITAFQVMGHLAKADGRVSEQEIATARALMDHMQLSAGQRRTAIDCFTEGKQPDFALDAALEAFQRAYRSRPALVQPWLDALLNVAYADGSLHPQTHTRLLYITEQLGIARLQFEALHTLFRAQRWTQQHTSGGHGSDDHAHRQRPHDRRPTTAVNSTAQAYSVLGLKRDASPDEIKLAYRRLIKQHHPDKLAASGVSSAVLARATEKTRQITAAYDYIREARGF